MLAAGLVVPCFAQTPSAAVSATPPPPPPTLAQELAKNRLTLNYQDGKLSGPGAEFLLREASAAQFTLVGEDHGLAETPRFTAALFDLIKPAGYSHLAVEIGPKVAARLEGLAAASDAQAKFAAFNRDYPFSAAFYFWREEAEMMEHVVKSMGGAPDTVWGIDQEFICSGAVHLERLVQLAPDDTARALALGHLDLARQDMKRMIETKNPTATFVCTTKPEAYAKLREAFASAGAEAAALIAALERSTEIYAMNATGRGWESNFTRAKLTKEYFRAYYDRAAKREGRAPRVLFKYGANHMTRGRSVLGVYDVGNLVSELAEFHGTRSFHLAVICTQGTVNRYMPFAGNTAAKQQPYDVVKAFGELGDVKPLIEAADPQAWTLIDVRPVRRFLFRRYKDIDRNLWENLWGYDAVLVIPQGTAATLFE
jgi:hypothetical protein